jgi:hypothetical protein
LKLGLAVRDIEDKSKVRTKEKEKRNKREKEKKKPIKSGAPDASSGGSA